MKSGLIDQDWRFIKDDPPGNTVNLAYDKSWLLPSGNSLLKDPAKRATRPNGNWGDGVPYTAVNFDDSSWRLVNLPHAIEGPFSTAGGGGMGRRPSAGVVWYRKSLNIPASSSGKSLFLDIDGAMSYSQVWLNGIFIGGWPFGYSSFRLNLTPYAKPGEKNVLAIRLDNPPASSRWYPGGGLYRNYPEWHEQDLRAMLHRDRNHPSVILWSIGNELGEQTGGAAGAALAKELTDICHEEDPTRPTISGMNSAQAVSPFPAPIDTVGLNYQGAGLFYLGEPTPFNESRSSYFGIIDLAGFKKDRFYLYQSYWRPDFPMAHILPHWTWPDRAGQVTPVHVYTSGTEAEFFLNERSLGRKAKARNEYRLRWDERSPLSVRNVVSLGRLS